MSLQNPLLATNGRLRLLFMCVENSCRSQMAEAFACKHGRGQVEVHSAGTRPSGRVHPSAIAAMREIGYDLERHRSKGLPDVPSVEFDVLVTMGCGEGCIPVRARRREEWNIPAPKDMPPDQFRAVRNQIEEQVRQLLADLRLVASVRVRAQ
jgi:protein-tyrosine-phosphatase